MIAFIEEHKSVVKSKSKTTDASKKKRSDFLKDADKLFWIGRPDIKCILKKSSVSNEQYKKDVEFLKIQKKHREVACLGSVDSSYRITKKKALERKNSRNRAKKNEASKHEQEVADSESTSSETDEASQSEDLNEHFEPTPKKTKSNPKFGKNFAKNLAMTATVRSVSANSMVHICTDLLVNAGEEINEYSLSTSTIQRSKKKACSDNTARYQEGITRLVQNSKFPITLHYDGKMLSQLSGKDSSLEVLDRIAVSINVDGEIKLLGIPTAESGGSEDQFNAIDETLKNYQCLHGKVKCLCYDTCTVNTGPHTEVNRRFCDKYGEDILCFECMRHTTELNISHYRSCVMSHGSKAPEDLHFKRFKSSWNSIKEDIDYNKLKLFDLQKIKGTYLESKVQEAKDFYQTVLNEKVNKFIKKIISIFLNLY